MPLTPVARLATAALVWWSTVAVSPRDDPGDSGSQVPALHRALDRYSGGDHESAIASVDRATTTAGALRAAAEQWMQSGEASTRTRRQRVAAAFTLEVVWTPTRVPVVPWDFEWKTSWAKPWDTQVSNVRSALPIVAWGCDVISTAQDRHPADSLWFLASIGALQDAGASAALLEYRAKPGPQASWDLIVHFERGDARLVPDYLARLREALR